MFTVVREVTREEAIEILRGYGFKDLDRLSDRKIAERLEFVAASPVRAPAKTKSHQDVLDAIRDDVRSLVREEVRTLTAPAPQSKEPRGRKKRGIQATIVALLRKGTPERPVTLDQIMKVLVKRFPDRDPEGMKATARGLTYWVPRNYEQDVVRSGKGYYAPHAE